MKELRAEKKPLLYDEESSRSRIDGNSTSDVIERSSSNCKDFDWRAPFIIKGFACLESLGFYGISTNLVIYLITVLHKSNILAATSYTNWMGTGFFTPFLGALIADSYLGNYKMILYSSSIYILGMVIITLSASIPSLKPNACTGNFCPPATKPQNLIFFSGLYLIAFGSGGVKSSLLPLGASQFDDQNPVQLQKRMTFFNWFYFCTNVGGVFSGTLIVWFQENISWSIGYSIATLCLFLAMMSFLYGMPMLQIQERRCSLLSPQDTDNSRSLDKEANAFISDTMEEASRSLTEHTPTKATDIKELLKLFPIWVTGIIYSVSYAQAETTFIEQGKSMNTKISSFSIPPASFAAFEILSFMFCVCLYDAIMPLTLKKLYLVRMGIGHLFMISTMVIAAIIESKRLKSVNMHILWQSLQYFLVAASEGLYYIGQLEFFYDQGPASMKSLSTSISFLTLSLGSYVSSVVVMIVSVATSRGGKGEGWISRDLDEGHLDYFFWLLAALGAVNFVCYVPFAWRYTLKNKLSSEF